ASTPAPRQDSGACLVAFGGGSRGRSRAWPMSTPKLNIIRLSDVQEQEISWFWQPYIPFGKIILLDGDPESGKTYLALKIAAAVTTGAGLPEYGMPAQRHEPANVLFMTGEDALADTIRPRFRKVCGDPSRFFVI